MSSILTMDEFPSRKNRKSNFWEVLSTFAFEPPVVDDADESKAYKRISIRYVGFIIYAIISNTIKCITISTIMV